MICAGVYGMRSVWLVVYDDAYWWWHCLSSHCPSTIIIFLLGRLILCYFPIKLNSTGADFFTCFCFIFLEPALLVKQGHIGQYPHNKTGGNRSCLYIFSTLVRWQKSRQITWVRDCCRPLIPIVPVEANVLCLRYLPSPLAAEVSRRSLIWYLGPNLTFK